MKKLLVIISVLSVLFGCTALEEANDSMGKDNVVDSLPSAGDEMANDSMGKDNVVEVESFVFEDQRYTLELPADYEIASGPEYGFINPKITESFPAIRIGLQSAGTKPSLNDVLEAEKSVLANLCGQTDVCGEITEYRTVEIDGKSAINFIVQYNGRSLDDPKGYTQEYHYYVPTIIYEYDSMTYPKDQKKYPHDYFLKFMIRANDKDDIEKQKAAFDDIMKTIVLK
ncbi:hypothetical protein KA036_02555 [Candidatus Gracilibacteria bacterium]|nr:hypothetical protein [Candidatus Gracilibacteria bacterium]